MLEEKLNELKKLDSKKNIFLKQFRQDNNKIINDLMPKAIETAIFILNNSSGFIKLKIGENIDGDYWPNTRIVFNDNDFKYLKLIIDQNIDDDGNEYDIASFVYDDTYDNTYDTKIAFPVELMFNDDWRNEVLENHNTILKEKAEKERNSELDFFNRIKDKYGI